MLIHDVACVSNYILFKAEQSVHCTHMFCVSVHPLMETWVASTFLASVTNVAMNMGV